MTTAPHRVIVALTAIALAASLALAPSATADVSDTIQVVKDGEELSNVEVVARLAEETFTGPIDRVLIGRDDDFADNMASAVMQGTAPLLLVPSDGPVPQRVLDLLDTYDPEEIVLLGGEVALSAAVEEELDGRYRVVRRSGATRFETAIDIAGNEVPGADTAILARGVSDPSAGDPTQQFADALAAGGWAADQGWPILLTPTSALPESVEAYLAESEIRNVMIMGGTAAVSRAVEDRLGELGIATTRVAGANRFGTAIEVATMRGFDEAAEAERVVLVEGQAADAWAGGFAAAAHAAANDAPIVLAHGSGIPDATESFLTPSGAFAQNGFFDDAVLTCVTQPEACGEARVLMGLPPEATITFTPEGGASPDAGTPVSVDVTTEGPAQVSLSGECIPSVTGTSPGTTSAIIASDFSGTCTVTTSVTFASGSVQVEAVTYDVRARTVEETTTSGILTGAAAGDRTYTWVPGHAELLTTLGADDGFAIDGAAATEEQFFATASVGDVVTQRVQTVRQSTTIVHELTNRMPSDYAEGVVGDVDLTAGTTSGPTAAIIEPVSGRPLRAFTLTGSVAVDGAAADQSRLTADISEGDHITIVPTPDGGQHLALTNGASQGPVFARVADTATGAVSFQVGSGGLLSSPNRGDVVSGPEHTRFVIPAHPQTPMEFTVNGVLVSRGQFRQLLTDGDQVTYSRAGGLERFAIAGESVASTITGRATETADLSGTGSVTLLVQGEGRVPQSITPDALAVVDGSPATPEQLRSAYTAGDAVSITTPTTTEPQRVELTNRLLDGAVAGADTTGNTYTVRTADGDLYVGMTYSQGTAPFANGVTTHTFTVNEQPVDERTFDTYLAEAGTTVVVTPHHVDPRTPSTPSVRHALTLPAPG